MVWWSSLTVSFPSLYVIATSKYARVVDVGRMLVRGALDSMFLRTTHDWELDGVKACLLRLQDQLVNKGEEDGWYGWF